MPEPDSEHGGFDPSNRRHHDVFISYAQMDKPIADAICAKLESRRIRCWIAPRDVPPSKEFPAAIIEGIDESEFLVLVFSSHANNSPHVIREVTNAVNKGRIILPVRVEDVLPSKSMEYLISVPHWLDAITPPLEKHIEELADTIEKILAANRKSIACPGCGTALSPQARFCKTCGTQIPGEGTTTPAGEQDRPPAAPPEREPALAEEPRPAGPAGINKRIPAALFAVIAVLVLLAVFLLFIAPAVQNAFLANNSGNTGTSGNTNTTTTPIDYRGEDALSKSVVLTTEPTQELPEKTALNLEIAKDSTNAVVTVLFTGGGGMGLVKDSTILLTRPDGTSISGKLDFNQRQTEVELQGSRGTDRLQVIVTMKSGKTYTIVDRLMPYRVRGAT